jgi:hypothetical protein
MSAFVAEAAAAHAADASSSVGEMSASDDCVSLQTLPPVLAMVVLSYLTPADIGHVACTSSVLRETALDEFVWRTVCLRAFPALAPAGRESLLPSASPASPKSAPRAFAPADGLWRAEFKERTETVKRQVRVVCGIVPTAHLCGVPPKPSHPPLCRPSPPPPPPPLRLRRSPTSGR